MVRAGVFDLDTCKSVLSQVASDLSGVMSVADTIDYLCTQHASVARFGDGEFACLVGRGIPFQQRSVVLQRRLLGILAAAPGDCLLAFHPCEEPDWDRVVRYGDLAYLDACFVQVSEPLLRHTAPGRVYGNALMSRLPAFEQAGTTRLRRLWDGRDVVLVTGRDSAFDFDERLFGNVASAAREYGLARNAHSDYDGLLARCLAYDRSRQFLVALGPTAAVLAWDLSRHGYQALDIGHLPNCFHEYLGEKRAPERERKDRAGAVPATRSLPP